jgi:hypothetical protein
MLVNRRLVTTCKVLQGLRKWDSLAVIGLWIAINASRGVSDGLTFGQYRKIMYLVEDNVSGTDMGVLYGPVSLLSGNRD